MRIAVVGGGIAGLAAARRARLAADAAGEPVEITLLEASDRLGGKLRTETIDGIPLEWGPDSFLAAKPAAAELARALGLGADLVAPGPEAARAYLLLKGRLRPLPAGLAMGVPTGIRPLLGAVRDGIVGPLGALRAGIEPLIPHSGAGDQTVADVTRRRLGRQVADRLVAPLVTGVFGAPADQISMRAALPQFADTRSLVLAMARPPRGAGPVFLTLRGGFGRLVETLAGTLATEEAMTRTPVVSLERRGGDFAVETGAGKVTAEAIVLAVPSPVASRLLRPLAPDAADALGGIEYRDSAVVLMRYKREDVGRALDASGYVVAPEDRATVAACTWLTTKWPHVEWGDRVWIRAVVTSERPLGLPDDELMRRVTSEAGRVIRAKHDPQDVRIHRWAQAMPVYAPGHSARVDAAERLLPDDVALAGASYRGFGIPDCVTSGEEAADRLLAHGSRP